MAYTQRGRRGGISLIYLGYKFEEKKLPMQYIDINKIMLAMLDPLQQILDTR